LEAKDVRKGIGVNTIRFMMLMIPKGYETAAPGTMPDAKAVEAMMNYNKSLQEAGVLLALDGLHPPSMGTRVTFSKGKPTVTNGPFLMPVNKRYPLEDLMKACRDYPMPGRRRLTFEYILMAGVNDSPQDAEKVALLLKSLHCKLNLILFNEFPGSEFKTPTPEAVASFQQVLLNHNYTTIIRASRGSDILAACGQLSGQSC
jgi:adenine C2-methylase RlmN of 23S rRNA A2503 and tRNA A37